MKPLNSEVFFKELCKPLDDCFLLFRAVAAAEAGDGWEDLVNIRAGRFERTVAERVGDEALRFCGLQLFFCDDLLQLLLFLLLHITLPVAVNIRCSVDRTNKAVDQVLFAAQLDAGVNRPADGSQDAFVLAVRFMVLHNQHQDIINVDLHLPDELDLEGNTIAGNESYCLLPVQRRHCLKRLRGHLQNYQYQNRCAATQRNVPLRCISTMSA